MARLESCLMLSEVPISRCTKLTKPPRLFRGRPAPTPILSLGPLSTNRSPTLKITVIATGFDIEAAKALEKLRVKRFEEFKEDKGDGGDKGDAEDGEEKNVKLGNDFEVEDKYDIPTFLRKG